MRVIVGNKTVTALDQSEDALALADATRAANQNADAENIDHAAKLGHRRRKIDFQSDCRGVDEFHRNHRRAENRDTTFVGDGQQIGIEMKSATATIQGIFCSQSARNRAVEPRR